MGNAYSYRHHIIPFHEWKRRINPKATRYDKEFNALDNVVWLTLEQHIQVHQLLIELNASEYDIIAIKMMLGQIGKEAARREASQVANIGHERNLGFKHTEESKQKISASLTGRKLTDGHKQEMSNVRIGRKRGLYNKKSCKL